MECFEVFISSRARLQWNRKCPRCIKWATKELSIKPIPPAPYRLGDCDTRCKCICKIGKRWQIFRRCNSLIVKIGNDTTECNRAPNSKAAIPDFEDSMPDSEEFYGEDLAKIKDFPVEKAKIISLYLEF